MGRKVEPGSIDPTLNRRSENADQSSQPPTQISVEDASFYISFMRERAGLTDQVALARVIGQLAEKAAGMVARDREGNTPHYEILPLE